MIEAARANRFDMVSFAPRFAGMTTAEQWVQPAMLTTLDHRTGAAGGRATRPDCVLANGQCFLARASLLAEGGGYAPAQRSFSDDVTLARHYAASGARVGFLDGSRLYVVRVVLVVRPDVARVGPSIDLRDPRRAHVRPLDAVRCSCSRRRCPSRSSQPAAAGPHRPARLTEMDMLIGINAAFVLMRVVLLAALAGSYERPDLAFWRIADSPIRSPCSACCCPP